MSNKNRAPSWLLAGLTLLVICHFRFGIGVLAWFVPAFLLHALRLRPSKKFAALFLGLSMVAWSIATLKIITDPLPPIFALAYGVPLGFALGLPYLFSEALRRRLGEGMGTLSFPALVVLCEWSLHALLPLGTWGAMFNTQLDNLTLLQLASVTGPHGISALMAGAGSLLARAMAGQRQSLRVPATVAGLALLAVVVFGQARLALSTGDGLSMRTVAAVGTDSTVGASTSLPTKEENAKVDRGLFERTEAAARAGATLVVWNEAATVVYPEDEDDWTRRVQALAQRLKVSIVAAYVVPASVEPLEYENKYAYVRPDGSIDHVYFKHEPVPGEPAVRGTGPMPLAIEEGQRISGAICYDYDFPRLGLQHAELDADLVVLPSSDWRGIDPIHTEMAKLRAIEGGHALIRSTRFGLSAGFDAWGRSRGQLSHFDEGDRVLIMTLPRKGVTTIYGSLGDWLPLTCLIFLLGAVWQLAFGPCRRLLPCRGERHGPIGRDTRSRRGV